MPSSFWHRGLLVVAMAGALSLVAQADDPPAPEPCNPSDPFDECMEMTANCQEHGGVQYVSLAIQNEGNGVERISCAVSCEDGSSDSHVCVTEPRNPPEPDPK